MFVWVSLESLDKHHFVVQFERLVIVSTFKPHFQIKRTQCDVSHEEETRREEEEGQFRAFTAGVSPS